MPQFNSQTQVQIMDQLNKMHGTVAYNIMDVINGAINSDEEIGTAEKKEIEEGIRILQNDLSNLKTVINNMKRKGEDLRGIERVAKKMYNNVTEMKSLIKV